MKLIASFWKNFKTQPEIWFFSGFLLTFTLTIRKVLWFLPLRGEFNEYAGVYLYLSDIFLILTISAWVYTILYNKIDILSILKNVPRETLIIPLVLVIWSFSSLIWAENRFVAIFRSVKILEFYLLYVLILIRFFYWNVKDNIPSQQGCSTLEAREMFHPSKNVPRGTSYRTSVEHFFATGQAWNNSQNKSGTILHKAFGLIIVIGLFQAIIGIMQFILQYSIGLFWLREGLISPDIAGVAKVIFNGEIFIRAYGLFPHPNILGGFLVFSTFISWLYYKMFHPRSKRIVPRGTILCSGASVEHFIGQAWNNFLLRDKRGTLMFKLILGIQFLALILTFSKSAILGLFLGLMYYSYIIVPRGTIVYFFKKKKRLIITTILIIIFAVLIIKPDFYSFLFKGLNERSVYVNVSRGTIRDNLILGIGNDQFVLNMENLSVIKENWMLEPVHNVFLLIWSELGIVGLTILVLFIWHTLKLFHLRSKEIVLSQKECSTWNIPQDKHGTSYGAGVEQSQNLSGNSLVNVKNTFGAIFIGLLFIMFFDHYLWDIQQGSFLLWMTMGFLVGAGEYKHYLTK